jgi:hypothetical protein
VATPLLRSRLLYQCLHSTRQALNEEKGAIHSIVLFEKFLNIFVCINVGVMHSMCIGLGVLVTSIFAYAFAR